MSRALGFQTPQGSVHASLTRWREAMILDLQHAAIRDQRKATAIRLVHAVLLGEFGQHTLQKCSLAVGSWSKNCLERERPPASTSSTMLQAMLQADKLFRRSDVDGNLLLDCEEMHELLSSVVKSEGLPRTPLQIEVRVACTVPRV